MVVTSHKTRPSHDHQHARQVFKLPLPRPHICCKIRHQIHQRNKGKRYKIQQPYQRQAHILFKIPNRSHQNHSSIGRQLGTSRSEYSNQARTNRIIIIILFYPMVITPPVGRREAAQRPPSDPWKLILPPSVLPPLWLPCGRWCTCRSGC